MVTMSGLFTVAMVMVTALAWLRTAVRASRASRFTGGSSMGQGPVRGVLGRAAPVTSAQVQVTGSPEFGLNGLVAISEPHLFSIVYRYHPRGHHVKMVSCPIA
ncbi:hypothetical protein GCM10008960_15840 [Deinococcus sedimenti]|uniref:Secreted protein n=1 Tax=Deinococcus sedimenti TaxID=1867090 RepID=A0ABQ2S4X5_9DEIO|nr:hypothetical protein GCM10008960_15840 [Deinococcus sedimenti]